MTDNKLTDNEIKKALECCSQGITIKACENCPLNSDDNVINLSCLNLEKSCIDLINRQQAEIERLKAEEEKYPFKCVMPFNSMVCSKSIEDYDRLVGDIGSDAIKEFAEKLKKDLDEVAKIEWNSKSAPTSWSVAYEEFMDIIDRYVEEWAGEE